MSSPQRERPRRSVRSVISSPILALCSRFLFNIRLSDGFAIVPGGLQTGAATCMRETIGYLKWRSLHTFRQQHQLEHNAPRKICQTRKGSSSLSPLEAGGEASGDAQAASEDASTDQPEMQQVMGSIAPSWAGNDTEKVDRRSQVIVGSVIAANQTEFPYPIDSFPPLINSEVYYNGTSERFWWNQNAEAVCVYVPVPPAFDVSRVEFVAKTGFVSLKLEGEEVLSGTTFYGIDGYQSLFVLDHENDPPFVQLELYKLREYQNWEDLLVEGSNFIPGGGSG